MLTLRENPNRTPRVTTYTQNYDSDESDSSEKEYNRKLCRQARLSSSTTIKCKESTKRSSPVILKKLQKAAENHKLAILQSHPSVNRK
jgi:hypothetical protein